MKKISAKKVNINFPAELLDRLDKYSGEMCTTRTSVVVTACNQFLISNEIRETLIGMTMAMKKLADSAADGKIDSNLLEEIEEYSKAIKLITGT